MFNHPAPGRGMRLQRLCRSGRPGRGGVDQASYAATTVTGSSVTAPSTIR